jgi:acetyl-CoA carboxylase biotin carboxyl carrier protein
MIGNRKGDVRMDLEKIEGLVKIIENSSLTEFTLKEGDLKITMSKLDHPPVMAQGMPMMPPPPAAGASAPAAAHAEEIEEEKLFITSPIVGTFYSAPAPDVPAFVKVGDHVKNGQTVCILEAMKLMNEIQAEFDCEIEAVLVSNEQKVEYGQPLFRVKKL